MNTLTKRFYCAVCLMAVLLNLSGCGTGSSDTDRIRLCEVTHSVFYAPLYATIELGYFEEEGLQIELSNGAVRIKS